MKFLIIPAWLALAVTLSATPKFGVVRTTDVFRALPSTAAMQEKMRAQRNEILKSPLAARYRASLTEIKYLELQIGALKEEMETENGMKLTRAYAFKRWESEKLKQEFEEYQAAEDKRIKAEMIAATRKSLSLITATAQQLAEERGLDGVLDTSGNSNTGIPLVLYAANAEDLTEEVSRLLKQASPNK